MPKLFIYTEKSRIKEELFLLKICNLLLNAFRTSISITEMEQVLQNYFKKENSKSIVNELINTQLFEQKNNTLFILIKKEELKECIKEAEYYLDPLREQLGPNWVPGHLGYKAFKLRKEVIENKYDYIGASIQEKKVFGIGDTAIVLKKNKNDDPEYHSYLPHKRFWGNNNSIPDGCDIAKELVKKYGNMNDSHLRYICEYDE